MVGRLKLLLTRLKTKKVYLSLLGFLVAVVLISIFLWQRGGQIQKSSPIVSPPVANQKPKVSSPPAVSFGNYENKALFPVLPSSLKTYTLKTDYTFEEATEFGRKLGLTEVKKADDTYVVMSNFKEQNNIGMLVFNRKTGAFSLQSHGVRKPVIAGNNIYETAFNYLKELNIADETVACNITFQRKNIKNVTYVECHRDWNNIGLPILNYIGTLNIPEENSLSSLSLGRTGDYSPVDAQIYNTSTGQDGKARPSDFNTATVGITNDGIILSVESNLRPVKQSQSILDTDLLSPQEALDKFYSHKSEFSLTIPAGSGFLDWNKVYPGNKAISQKAIITDYVLSYLEKPADAKQTTLIPVYLIRGTAQLESGYTVRFIETISALRKTPALTRNSENSVLGDQDEADKNLQFKTFTPSNMPTSPVTNAPSPSLTIIPTTTSNPEEIYDFSNCHEKEGFSVPHENTEVTLFIPGMGQMTVYISIWKSIATGFAGGTEHVYFFKGASFPINTIGEVRNAFYKAVEDQYLISMSKFIKENNLSSKTEENPPITIEKLYDIIVHSPIILPLYENQKENILGNIIPPQSGSHIPEITGWGGACSLSCAAMTKNVEAKILEIIKNQKIDEWADKENIFPSVTLNTGGGLSWVAIDELEGVRQSPQFYAQLGFNLDCYISGSSPSIYFYPTVDTYIAVSLPKSLSYSYPSTINNNVLNVLAYPDGNIKLNGQDYSRLYYEYDKNKVKFINPKDGFIVKSTNWESFIKNNLSLKLNLNNKETGDLITDVKNALSDIKINKYPYIKISFVDKAELNEKLPLSFSPLPDKIYRLHLLLTPLTSYQAVIEPALNKIQRQGFTVVEIGVSKN